MKEKCECWLPQMGGGTPYKYQNFAVGPVLAQLISPAAALIFRSVISYVYE